MKQFSKPEIRHGMYLCTPNRTRSQAMSETGSGGPLRHPPSIPKPSIPPFITSAIDQGHQLSLDDYRTCTSERKLVSYERPVNSS